MNYQKINIPQFIITAIILFFNAIMIIFPKEFFEGAKNGLWIWFNTVIPSLLPFMITINCLTQMNVPRAAGKYLQPAVSRLFRLDGTQAFVLITGITAGYPMGLKTCAALYADGEISKPAAYRLMLCCNNAGALFILGTVGAGFFGDVKVGYFILICSLLSVFTIVFFTGFTSKKPSKDNTSPALTPFSRKILSDSLKNAGISIFYIGGYIILFSVLTKAFEILHIFDGLAGFFPFDKELAKAAAAGIFEVTNGCKYAAGQGMNGVLLCAALCGFGGLSVHAQSTEFLNDTDLSCLPYLFGKTLTALLCLFYGRILWTFFF